MVQFLDIFPVLWITDLDAVDIVTYHQFVFSPQQDHSSVYVLHCCVFCYSQQIAVGAWTGKAALDLEVLPAISLSN